MSDLESGKESDAKRARPSADDVSARAGRVHFIGRERERAVLRAAIESALARAPRVILLCGEAGIGKSRLLAEAMNAAKEFGGHVAIGRCVDEIGLPPYLPWIGALTSLSRDSSLPLGPGTLDLGAMLLDPDLISSSHASPEVRRLRAFDAVCHAISAAAADRLLFLALEDLQWSDASSNQLLRYLAVNLPEAKILIAGTMRSDEAVANADLRRSIDELERHRLLIQVDLRPLSATETGQLISGLAADLSPATVEAIREFSGGNPFLTEEIVRGLANDDALWSDQPPLLSMPREASTGIQRRFSRLSETARTAVEIASLAGRNVSAELLAGALGRDIDLVVIDLDEAAGASLLRRPSQGDELRADEVDYVFLHDRIRETIASAVHPGRRPRLHRRLADALEERLDADPSTVTLSALLRHRQAANQPADAAAIAFRLGRRAFRSHAYEEAAQAFSTAITLNPDETRGDDLLNLGDALLFSGSNEAIAAYRRAESHFSDRRDQAGVARAQRRLGSAYLRREEHDLAVACFKNSIQNWEEALRPDDVELIGTLVDLCTVLGSSLGEFDQAIANGNRALDLAKRADASSGSEPRARLALAQATMRAGRLAEGRAVLEPALALSLHSDDLDLSAEIAGALANHAYWTGDLDASERYSRRRREFGLKGGDPYALRHARPWLAITEIARGEWAKADALINEAKDDLRRVDSPEPHAFLNQLAGVAAIQQGRISEGVELLETAIAGFRGFGPATLPWYLGLLAHGYLSAGDLPRARRTTQETESVLSALPDGALPRAPSLAQLGIISVRTNDLTGVRRWYAALQPYAGQHHWVLIDRALGMLASALGDDRAADLHFSAAASIAIRGGIRPELALTIAEQAASGSARHERKVEALAQLDALGMTAEADRFRALFGLVSTTLPAGLSEREAEVLILVAQGLTNREIGERLNISEKTVTNHLTHVFTKADLENRAAAVAFAHRTGVVR